MKIIFLKLICKTSHIMDNMIMKMQFMQRKWIYWFFMTFGQLLTFDQSWTFVDFFLIFLKYEDRNIFDME
jgi:hypothetical protein